MQRQRLKPNYANEKAGNKPLSTRSAAAVALMTMLLAGNMAEAKSVEKTESSKQFAGLADYYHHSLYGQRTASGQVLKKEALTAAHRTLPFGTRVHVVNKRTGKSCVVTINDRGPYTKSKVIDLSHAAASQLGLLQAGTGNVACTVLKAGEVAPGKGRTDVDKGGK